LSEPYSTSSGWLGSIGSRPVSAPELLACILLAVAAVVVWRPSIAETAAGRLQPLRRRPGRPALSSLLARLPARFHATGGHPPALAVANAADLIAACLDAGAVPAAALQAAGAAMGGKVGERLCEAGRSLADGDPALVAFGDAGPLRPVAAIVSRSLQTGSAMTEQLTALAEQIRTDDHFDRLEKAQRVGVLSALPLGVCLLPAFLLLAVVPAVLGLGASVGH
jgi:hypothetical protein